MNGFVIFKNNFSRALEKKSIIVMAVIFIPMMIGLAVYFTGKIDNKGCVAIVSQRNISYENNKYFTFRTLKVKPKMSELLTNKYAAIAEEGKYGSFEVTTINGDKIKKALSSFLKDPHKLIQIEENKRGVGTNILGFLVMIVLFQQIAFMFLYPEDRDIKTFKRVLIAPVSENIYLLSQGFFNFVMVYIPTLITIILMKVIFNINIGFNYLTLAILSGILSLLGTAFALFITSVIDTLENSMMLAQFLVTITTVISGSFYSFSENNKLLDFIIKILPQKQYLILIEGVDNGKGFSNNLGG